jgi:hypothetical protein
MEKNCKEKSYNRLNNYLVFIGIFNFLGGNFESEQTLFHSCLPFPKNLSQYIFANLIEQI